MAQPSNAARLAAQPFELILSSGFFGFFAHAGVVRALEELGLRPALVGGSSAGALVSGMWAAGLSAEAIRDRLFSLRREDFWDPHPGLGLLRGRLFRERLERVLDASTFAACRAPFHASVYDPVRRRVRVVTEGALAPAIQASCAVPLLFHPVWIDGRPYVDGGVADRPGLQGAHASDRVFFHHLASRSPWRRPGSPSMEIPARERMTTLVVRDLPRVGPFRLPAGRRAFERARDATRAALLRPVASPVVEA